MVEYSNSDRKKCYDCGQFLSLDNFNKKRSRCKPCDKFHKIFYKYKITKEQYFKMLVAQDGKCSICILAKELIIDHDHSCCKGELSCGKCIRELICQDCNTLLGRAHDSARILASAISYLERNIISA